MKKHRRSLGFTMAELLIVVAILSVLAGVGIVAVATYQRKVEHVELDVTAKEIFVAAQNQMTMAKTQNYWGLEDKTTDDETAFGYRETGTDTGVYYLVVNGGDVAPEAASTFWENMMLTMDTMEEVARNGSYIIRHQPRSGLVLDVFFCKPTGRYEHNLSQDDYATLLSLRDTEGGESKASGRITYGEEKSIVGWYGGVEAADIRTMVTDMLEPPEIEIENGSRLLVKIVDRNAAGNPAVGVGYTVKLIVRGLKMESGKQVESGAMKAVLLRYDETADVDGVQTGPRLAFDAATGEYTVKLDAITDLDSAGATLSFANFASDTDVAFVPGQDIAIEAVAYNNKLLTSIATSDREITNSLFAELASDSQTVSISNIRHLENLDAAVSNVNSGTTTSTATLTMPLKAVQITDLEWDKFKTDIGGTVKVYSLNRSTPTDSADNCYRPVSPAYRLSYDGQSENRVVTEGATDTDPKKITTTTVNHSIWGIPVNVVADASTMVAGPSGLFGALPDGDAGATIANVALINFEIASSEGNAGALAGTLGKNYTVTNVLAYNTNTARTPTIRATTSGDAGGLIGMADTGCAINQSAAALVVSTKSGNAGGLIGTAVSGRVNQCYAGGHTVTAAYDGTTYNVVSEAGTAGGLIGVAGSAAISNSYSTCSASGTTAAGFVGTATGSISNCYATGLVSGSDADQERAFAVTLSSTPTNCKYFEIVNERYNDTDGTFSYLEPGNDAVKPLDEDVGKETTYKPQSYEDFVGSDVNGADDDPTNDSKDTVWQTAVVYDATLTKYYGEGNYNLQTVGELSNASMEDYFVAKHYGDWPAPEVFTINEKP